MRGAIDRLWLLPVLFFTGCALNLKEHIHTEQSGIHARIEQAQTVARQPQPSSPYLVNEQAPKFTRRSVPFQRTDPFPAHLGNITMRVPGRHNLSAIAEMLEQLIGIPVVMSPDALQDAAMFAVGSVTTPTSNVEKASEAMQANEAILRQSARAGASVTTYSDKELRNTFELNYSGSITGFLDAIATRAALQWQYQSGRITFSRLVTRAIFVKALAGSLKSSGSVNLGSNISASTQIESDASTFP